VVVLVDGGAKVVGGVAGEAVRSALVVFRKLRLTQVESQSPRSLIHSSS
jgi:hypothetical protein